MTTWWKSLMMTFKDMGKQTLTCSKGKTSNSRMKSLSQRRSWMSARRSRQCKTTTSLNQCPAPSSITWWVKSPKLLAAKSTSLTWPVMEMFSAQVPATCALLAMEDRFQFQALKFLSHWKKSVWFRFPAVRAILLSSPIEVTFTLGAEGLKVSSVFPQPSNWQLSLLTSNTSMANKLLELQQALSTHWLSLKMAVCMGGVKPVLASLVLISIGMLDCQHRSGSHQLQMAAMF